MAMTDEQLKDKLMAVLDNLDDQQKAAIQVEAAKKGQDVVDFFFDMIIAEEEKQISPDEVL